MNINALRERRSVMARDARQLLDSTKDVKWTPEHQSKYDALTGEIVDLDARIEREQKILDLSAEKAFDNMVHKPANSKDADPTSERGMFNVFARHGINGMSLEQARVFNTMSTTTGAEGGYTIQSEVATSVIDAIKSLGGMREVAQLIRTATGNPMSFPTSDGTSEEGELLAENAPASGLDPTFGTVGLPVYKYGSKIIGVPFELLQDSSIDVEAFIRARIAARIARITNKHFTIGTGTGQPMGIVPASSVGKTGQTGQTATVTYDDLADLVESVDEAYLEQGGCRFMFNQSTRKVLRKLKDSSGRPIWTPGYELGITAGTPDLLLGYQVKINNHMAAMAANAKSIAFGDLSKYAIRDAMQLSLFRFTDSVYVSKGQVGFLAWARSGGNLLDTNAVKLYQNSAT